MNWTRLGVWGVWEYWTPDGHDIYRRKESPHNFIGPDGSPSGVRWESTYEHFTRFVAGRLAV